MGKRRSFTPEFKAQIVLQYISGEKTNAELCREHHVSAQQLGNWKKQFLVNASRVFEDHHRHQEDSERVAELERMVGKLTMQLEIAKKVSTICSSAASGNGR